MLLKLEKEKIIKAVDKFFFKKKSNIPLSTEKVKQYYLGAYTSLGDFIDYLLKIMHKYQQDNRKSSILLKKYYEEENFEKIINLLFWERDAKYFHISTPDGILIFNIEICADAQERRQG